jgi:hypothetical protein
MDLVRLADFYCALPKLSPSLYAVLWNSPDFVDEIPEYSSEILPCAKKLRHPILFREALCHVINNGPIENKIRCSYLFVLQNTQGYLSVVVELE